MAADGTDRRRERIRRFINQSAALRARLGRDDRLGVITFNHQARLDVPLSPPGQVVLGDADLYADPDPGDTDLGAALALALESLPDRGPRRIVLISAGVADEGGRENGTREVKYQLGRIREAGVQIDVLPLGTDAAGLALLEELRAPTETDGLRLQGELRSLVGKTYRDDAAVLDEAIRYGDVFRPVPVLPPAPKSPKAPPSSRSLA
jgi:Mg-chelatase subunit ChlD